MIYKETPTQIPRARLVKLAESVSKREFRKNSDAVINLVFTDAARIRSLNRLYRGKNKVTDVLSFPLDSEAKADDIFGEVYICVSVAERQARGYGATLPTEYLRLACHGFLHLFGHDHQRPAEEKRMKGKEDTYLAGIMSKLPL